MLDDLVENFSLNNLLRSNVYIHIYLQTSSDGNQTTSTLSISFSKTDAGKLLTCKAYNHAIPSEPLEDGWKLDIQCKLRNIKKLFAQKSIGVDSSVHRSYCCKVY